MSERHCLICDGVVLSEEAWVDGVAPMRIWLCPRHWDGAAFMRTEKGRYIYFNDNKPGRYAVGYPQDEA